MIKFVILSSRLGKSRLEKFYAPIPVSNRPRVVKEVTQNVINRPIGAAHVIETNEYKVVYKRYASMYFIIGCDDDDNELLGLGFIHHFVEVLDRYFGNACELDLIFNFHKVHMILDELMIDGRCIESSKKSALRNIGAQDVIIEDSLQQSGGILAGGDFGKRGVHSL